MTRKIAERIPADLLQRDLEKYRERAIKLGATDAKVITSDMVIIDERVRAKCIYPKCSSYGTNAHCPPHSMNLQDARELIGKYEYGILIDLRVSTELFAGPNVVKLRSSIPSGLKIYETVSKIEAEAFYDGYYLALGFGAGPCKPHFCPDVECVALKQGQACSHALRARASMEAIGMDVYTMATKAGWDIYPIGKGTEPLGVPYGHRLGLVLIY
ncbi:DUF2284 domain-containing protein [Chloroflexota bacterium]